MTEAVSVFYNQHKYRLFPLLPLYHTDTSIVLDNMTTALTTSTSSFPSGFITIQAQNPFKLQTYAAVFWGVDKYFCIDSATKMMINDGVS